MTVLAGRTLLHPPPGSLPTVRVMCKESSSSAPLVAGHRVGHDTIEQPLGRGGTGEVHRAHDEQLDAPCAPAGGPRTVEACER